MFKFLGLLMLSGGWALAASCLYVVRSPNGIAVLPKDRLSFTDTYADTRLWTMKDVPSHSALVLRLVGSDRAHLLAHVAESERLADISQRLLNAAKENKSDEVAITSGRQGNLLDLAWGS
jgi:hypothetical protein